MPTLSTLRNWLSAAWRDSVWSKVIAAGIIAAIVAVWVSAKGYWPSIGRAVAQAMSWLASPTPTSNWLLLLLGFCAAIVLGYAALCVWHSLFQKWHRYTSDEFDGIRWRWRWARKRRLLYTKEIERLKSHCNSCGCEMPFHRSSNWEFSKFACENCKSPAPSFSKHSSDVRGSVQRRIMHKVETGDWPDAGKVK